MIILGHFIAFVIAFTLTLLNSLGLFYVSEWVFFPYTGTHFSQGFILGVIAFYFYFTRQDTEGKEVKELLAKALSKSFTFWVIIGLIYILK